MSGICLIKKCVRASQMEDADLDLEDINVAVMEEATRITTGIVPPSTSMEAPTEQVSTKQPTSKLKGLPVLIGPLNGSSESIDNKFPSMSLPQQSGCLPGINEPSISFDNSGMNYPIYLPQVITPVGRCITNALDNSNAASQKKPVVTPAQEEDTVRITRSTVSDTNGSASEIRAETNQVEPSHILTTLPLLGGRTLRVVSYDLKKEAPKARAGNCKPPPPSFGTLVHKMISEVAVTNPDIIHWVCDGEAFIVNHDHPGIGNVMSKFFQHKKYSSFQRQLNTYGWNKIRGGRFDGAFYNCNFHRDRGSEQDMAKLSRGAKKSAPTTIRKRSRATTSASTRVVSVDTVVSSIETASASRSATKPLKKRSPRPSKAKPKPRPVRGILKSTSSKKKPIDTVKASLDLSRMDSWAVLDYSVSHGEALATNSAFQSVNSSLEPDMGRAVPTMGGNSAVSLDDILNEKRWGKKALLRLHEPVKTRSSRRSALAEVSNGPPKTARKSSLKPSTSTPNKPAYGLRKPMRTSLRSKEQDAGQGEARAVHFADPLPSIETPSRIRPGASFLPVFVDEKSPTQMHPAANFPPAYFANEDSPFRTRPGASFLPVFEGEKFLTQMHPAANFPPAYFANEDSLSQTHPGATFPSVFALEESMAYLLHQPLLGLSPNMSRYPSGGTRYSSLLEADIGAANSFTSQPFCAAGFAGLYSSMGISSAQVESSERAHSPPSCGDFVSLSMDAAKKIHFNGPLTQYASPIPVRVSLAPGCTVQMSPIKPSPMNKEHYTESDQEGEKSPSVVITPSGLTTPSTIRYFNEAAVAQSTAAIVSQSKSSIEERSPSAFVPLSISSSSMKRAQSPSCLGPFLGWSRELSHALDLNDCLDDCHQVVPTPI